MRGCLGGIIVRVAAVLNFVVFSVFVGEKIGKSEFQGRRKNEEETGLYTRANIF